MAQLKHGNFSAVASSFRFFAAGAIFLKLALQGDGAMLSWSQSHKVVGVGGRQENGAVVGYEFIGCRQRRAREHGPQSSELRACEEVPGTCDSCVGLEEASELIGGVTWADQKSSTRL